MDNTVKESVGEIIGTMVITTEEYRELITRSTILNLIFFQARTAKYSSDVEQAVSAAMHLMGVAPQTQEGEPGC